MTKTNTRRHKTPKSWEFCDACDVYRGKNYHNFLQSNVTSVTYILRISFLCDAFRKYPSQVKLCITKFCDGFRQLYVTGCDTCEN